MLGVSIASPRHDHHDTPYSHPTLQRNNYDNYKIVGRNMKASPIVPIPLISHFILFIAIYLFIGITMYIYA